VSLAQRLKDAEPSRRGRPCAIGLVLGKLAARDAQALSDALAMPVTDPRRLSARAISEALSAEGFVISDQSISRHRNGACRCEFGRTVEG
jgi:hypothetical protein